MVNFSHTFSFNLDLIAPFQSSEIDEMIDRITRHQGVTGVMVFSKNGIVIKSTLEETLTKLWAALVGEVVRKARSVGKTIEEGSNLTMVRIHTAQHEIMISPEKDFVMVAFYKQTNENWNESQLRKFVQNFIQISWATCWT